MDKSLVLVEEKDGHARYRMLEVIRQYARERLRESGEEAQLHAAHARWLLDFAERAEAEFRGRQQGEWLSRLEAEHNDFAAVLQRSLEDGSDPEIALRFGGALGHFWFIRGHASAGRKWIEAALSRSAGVPADVRAKALHWAGMLAYSQGDNEEAKAHYDEALALWRSIGDRRGLARTVHALGHLLLDMGDHERGVPVIAEGLVLAEELGDPHVIAGMKSSLGELAFERGDLGEAARWFEEGLAISREHGFTRGVVTLLHNLGDVVRYMGDLDRAEALLGESLELARAIGDRRLAAYSLHSLGAVAVDKGEHERAKPRCRDALELCRELAERRGLAFVLETVAAAAAAAKDFERALRLAGAALRIREASRVMSPPVWQSVLDRHLGPAREAIGPEQAGRAFAEGRALTLEQAAECALQFLTDAGDATAESPRAGPKGST